MNQSFDAMAQAVPGEIVNGEHLLLGGIPGRLHDPSPGQTGEIPPAHFYKKRYTWDGDPEWIGCSIGCSFCYYRWIDNTSDTIGQGRKGLRRIGDPEGAARFLTESKLFLPDQDIVLLCARSDGSMQVDSVTRFLQAFPHHNPVFILHRGYFGKKQLEAWGADMRAIYSTTITANGPDLAWTPIKVEKQIAGVQFLLSQGISPRRISIMVGPINRNNLDGSLILLRQLADMGIVFATYRGCSVGNFGVSPDQQHLRSIGFLDGQQDEGAAPQGHDYYTMKNWLDPDVEQAILETGQQTGLSLYRHTGLLYRERFGKAVAYNRNNRWRQSLGQWHPIDPEALLTYLRDLGFTPLRVEQTREGYMVTLPEGETATEDIAMTVGARFQSSILFNRHRIAPTLDDLRFYTNHRLFAVPEALLAAAERQRKEG